jgi:hypothetical protein
VSNTISEKNRAAAEEIHAFVDGLTDDQLGQSIDGEWTASALLAHIAFWDRRASGNVDRVLADGAIQLKPVDLDVLNGALLPQWRLIPPREAATDSFRAAAELDDKLAALDEETVQRLVKTPELTIDRARHRLEHMNQIKHGVT